MQDIKLMVVGDSGIGKTSLLMTYAYNYFPVQAPPLFEREYRTIPIDNEQVNVDLWDCMSPRECERVRALRYPRTDIFLLCYSVACLKSLQNIRTHWFPEIREHVPKASVILVGLKSDLRLKSENGSGQISESKKSDCLIAMSDVKALSREVGAVCYVECSALKNERVNKVFKKAAQACRPSWKQKCAML